MSPTTMPWSVLMYGLDVNGHAPVAQPTKRYQA